MHPFIPTYLFKNLYSVLVLMLIGLYSYAQTPTITNVSPLSGTIGTVVTITGSGFNSTPANNIVYFGAVRAISVTASSSVSLTVVVPVGATYNYISVTNVAVNNTNLTSYSPLPFIVTFPNNNLTDFAIDPTVTISAASNAYRMALGDLNGDGKADLVVVDNNVSNSNIYVYVNNSVVGGVVSYALSNTLNLPASSSVVTGYTYNYAV